MDEKKQVMVKGPEENQEQQLAVRKRQAGMLREFIQQQGLSKNFGGRKDHIYYEGWSFLGELTGFHTSTKEIEELYTTYKGEEQWNGVRATVDLLDRDDKVVATVTASCSKDEPNWRYKPRFQLESMAQTRAASKAFRMRLAPIVALAGFEPTPAEEMSHEKENGQPPPMTEAKKPRGRPPKAGTSEDAGTGTELAFDNLLDREKIPLDAANDYVADLVRNAKKPTPPILVKERAIAHPDKFVEEFWIWFDAANNAPGPMDADTAGFEQR